MLTTLIEIKVAQRRLESKQDSMYQLLSELKDNADASFKPSEVEQGILSRLPLKSEEDIELVERQLQDKEETRRVLVSLILQIKY